MSVSGDVEERRDNLKLYPDVFNLAKQKKVIVEIFSDDKVLNPYSAIRLLFKRENKILLEKETILKCDNLEECFFCFNQNFTYIILEKVISENGKEKREKVSIPIVWHCLNWEGKPIFEEQFFEETYIRKNKVVAVRKNFLEIAFFERLNVEARTELFKINTDNKTFYTQKLFLEEGNEAVIRFFDNKNIVCLHDNR